MTNQDTDLLEGPEMDALRQLRAEVPAPTDAQRQAAWERVQGARSPARGTKGVARPWIVGAVAAVSVGVLAVGVGVAVLGGDEAPVAPVSTEMTTSTPTNPNPTPFVTGSVWEPQGPDDKKRMDTYRDEAIHLLPDGGVRIDFPKGMDPEAMTRALNREGIPVRIWAIAGEKHSWDTSAVIPIDGETGVDMDEEPGPVYPREKVTEERVDGPDSALASLTFEEIPTEPVDISYTP